MTWLLWRQHRRQGALAGGALAAFAVVLAITGVTMANTYRLALAACAQPGTDCSGLNLFTGDGAIVYTVNATVLVPALIGAFWGATSVGREYDTSTNLLAWTQSVTRRRWLLGKIVALMATSLLAGTALSVMVTWWSRTVNDLHGDRFDPLQFDIQGLVPVAYTLFAAALGLCAGAVWRRALPAIATTFVGYFAVRLGVELWLRPHYQAPVTVASGADSTGGWVQHSDLRLHGVPLTGPVRVPSACARAASRGAMDNCLGQRGYTFTTTLQPANRYWTFQWIEAGLFVALAAMLVVGAVFVVCRRDA